MTEVSPYLLNGHQSLSEERKLLLGGYFTHEYSLEAAALFNPSMVPHLDQSNLPPGSLRFILSLRATAKGRVSSIAFAAGYWTPASGVAMDLPSRYSLEPMQVPNSTFEKPLFERKLQELRLMGEFNGEVLNGLPDAFTMEELRASIGRTVEQLPESERETTKSVARETLMLARIQLRSAVRAGVGFVGAGPVPRHSFAEQRDRGRSLRPFPKGRRHADLLCDLHGVRRQDDPAPVSRNARFSSFKFITLNGPAVENKGMALFPRKIKGLYAMLGRQDAENIYVMFSDHLHFWDTMQLILERRFPWEFIQLGNCGSPIETEAGWLVISHGVGPMRKYCIGAFLLDRDEPTKVIGRLPEPLIKPNINERDGYVPNVVYSCGSLVHNRQLVIPYGISDYATTFATIPLDQVLAAME